MAPGALLLMSAAFYNGYPLVYPDSGDYIHRHDTPMRVVFYLLLTTPLRQTGSTWPFVAMHALITAHLIYLVLRTHTAHWLVLRFYCLLGLLVLLSSVSWYVSFLMPDIFSSAAILCVYLFVFRHEQLSKLEQSYLVALLLVSCLVHLSNLSGTLGLCAALVIFKLLFRTHVFQWRHLAVIACVVVTSFTLHIVRTQSVYNVTAPSAAAYVYPLAGLVRTGLVKNYLDDACQDQEYKICPYRDQFPRRGNEFIFLPDSPLHKLGGYLGYREEGSRLLRETILHQPVAVIQKWAELTWIQLGMVDTANWVFVPTVDMQWLTKHFETAYPSEVGRYRNSRQNVKTLPFPGLATVHTHVLKVCLILALILLGVRCWRDRAAYGPDIWLLVFTLLALLNTAAGSGLPSGEPEYRHMAKVVWLLPFSVGAVLLSSKTLLEWMEPWKTGKDDPQPENYDEGTWIA